MRATLSLSVAFALLLAGAAAHAEILEQILVKVNGEIFTKTELETRQVQALRQRGEVVDPKDATSAKLQRAIDEVTPQILVNVVDEMLIVQRGRELGYKLSDEQFQSIVDNIKRENKITTDEQWQAALRQEDMTMTDLRRQLERQMIVSRVQQNEVFGRIGVSDDEARQYYDTHQNEFTTASSVTLREILVAVPDNGTTLNVGLDEAAKAKADRIRARAEAGESFEKLAAELSDSPSKTNAGLIGPISIDDIAPALRDLIQKMKVGDLTPVIRNARGYQLLKLESKTDTQVMPFDQARQQISDRVFTDKRKAEFQKYLEKLRAEAIIEWKNAAIEKAYKDGLAQEAAGTTPAATPAPAKG